MRHTPNNAPKCPACGGSHYPATLGSGARVWCDNSPADPREEQARALRAEQARTLRAEARARTGEPLDAIDAARFRAALASEDFRFPA